MKHYLYLIAFFLSPLYVFSQDEATIHSIDPSEYPLIKAEFTLISNGKEVREFQENDIAIQDGGIKRTIEDYLCGEAEPTDFSAILVMDFSMSMERFIDEDDQTSGRRYEVMLRVVNDWIDKMNPSYSETALLWFASMAGIVSDYSSDKNALKNSLNNLPEFQSQTNYNSVFVNDKYGTLDNTVWSLAEHAKYKPVIVFLTDGEHMADGDDKVFRVDQAYKLAKEYDAYIFIIQLSNEELSVENETNLRTLASVEGKVAENLFLEVMSEDELTDTYDFIRDKARNMGIAPNCYLTWETDCAGGDDCYIRFPGFSNLQTSKTFYTVPEDKWPYLKIEPREIDIFTDDISSDGQTTIEVTAVNAPADISGLTANSNFSVDIPGGLVHLEAGESRQFTVNYTATDEHYKEARLEFISTSCDSLYFDVYGSMMPTASDVEMGTTRYGGDDLDLYVEEVMWNYTGRDFTVTDITFSGANPGDFVVIYPASDTLIPNNGALDCLFRFSPSGLNDRNAVLEIHVGGSKIISNIHGIGDGTPGVSAINPFRFENTNCNQGSRDTIIELNNGGSKILNILNIEVIEGEEYFSIGAFDDSIDKLGKMELPLSFGADDCLEKTGVIRVTSDAVDMPEYDIEVIGQMDSVALEAVSDVIDLAPVCLGGTTSATITVKSTSSLDIEAELSGNGITVLDGPITIEPDGEAKFAFEVVADMQQDGPFTLNAHITELNCAVSKEFKINGNAYDPEIDEAMEPTISSAKGVPFIKKYEFVNLSNNEFEVDALALVVSEEIKLYGEQSEKTVEAGGTYEFEFQYTPVDDNIDYDTLIINISPCGYEVRLPVTGTPNPSTINIIAGNGKGLAGESLLIPISLTDPVDFAAAGPERVYTNVVYDNDMLEFTGTSSRSDDTLSKHKVISVDFPVDDVDSDQPEIYVLPFNIREYAGDLEQSEIVLFNSRVDLNNVQFNEYSGTFTFIPSTAEIHTELSSYKAWPGQIINVPIILDSIKNINKATHGDIRFDIRFDGRILEPAGDTPLGSIEGNDRVIHYVVPIPEDFDRTTWTLFTMQLRAMLGPVKSSSIVIEVPESMKGNIFFEPIGGMFELQECIIGEDVADGKSARMRLFDPSKTAGLIMASPQPAEDYLDIQFSTKHKDMTTLALYDNLGSVRKLVFSGVPKSGQHSIRVSTDDISAGTYYLILKTPTRQYSSPVVIIK